MTRERIVIVGGGVVGSSIAWHLCEGGLAGAVTVVERDPTYRRASSALAMGGIRQQFGSAANIRLAQHSIRFYARFDRRLAAGGHRPRARFRQRGYLFLADAAAADRLDARQARQRALGAQVERLDVAAIRALAPDLVLDDIRFGLFSPEDGYADPRAVLAGFRALAAAAGADYVTDEVRRVDAANGRVRGVTLASGTALPAQAIVNAAGPFAAQLAACAGLDLPVAPVRQQLVRCDLPHVWPHRFPVVVDPGGVHWRHDDPVRPGDPDRIVVACTMPDEPPGERFEYDRSWWERTVRPALVARLPAFDAIGRVTGWAGLYEMTPDHNPLLGEHPELAGFYLANGFSGHGLMMAPATGAALADLIRTGAPQLDISAFDPGRFARGEPFHDDALI